MTKEHKRFDLQLYLRREPVTLALLTALTIVLFGAVAGLSRLYHQQQDSLADRWYSRGTADLGAQRYGAAVVDFRTSLLYSRDNYSYQLNLAEALIGEKRFDEARAYLVNLWERQPENGLVNLEMARIDAERGNTDSALRYYHNAIYAVWPGNQDVERLDTRLELVDLLLRIGNKAQADSELIALAANLGNESTQHTHAGQLFLQAQDDQRALEQFRLALSGKHRDQAALTGAGDAAFNLGQYRVAERYLRQAVASGDKGSQGKLKTAELVINMDPFRPQVKATQRSRIVVDAFKAAGERLQACAAPGPFALPAATLVNLTQNWTKLKPEISLPALKSNPDLVNTAMGVVFDVERETSGLCGGSTETDKALLLIAKLHEGL